ncbi:carboxypeptidase-like regulatory domain-containing protein [Hymenobacter sp. M29]|uniref:Carboxypeptidase-like regulatory domain-containing protein n=1 Tax=Hymenobacter mellowenesis TaxID=3063995 RepID=A0ABT9A5U0_9BACT|nr:carboxypeptidase-like regulatory domain-containing protein [Hymenobacter sp. M29]MDO7845206.1 carboxypeptidase-like regulatory domain-containing protein [Hymenobacter sp. M29]
MTSSQAPRIPQPCPESWAAMTPTAQGRHCAVCATEVVDFTRMSEAEVLAFLAARSGQRVCGLMAAPLTPRPAARLQGPRRWLWAALALLGWHPVASCASKPPQAPPPTPTAAVADPAASQKSIVIRGQVLDGEKGPGVAGAFVFINKTEYGATTDENGRFELVLASSWAPVKAGALTLHVQGNPFELKPQDVPVNVRTAVQPIELKIKLQSTEGRGHIMGRMVPPVPPMTPPRG